MIHTINLLDTENEEELEATKLEKIEEAEGNTGTVEPNCFEAALGATANKIETVRFQYDGMLAIHVTPVGDKLQCDNYSNQALTLSRPRAFIKLSMHELTCNTRLSKMRYTAT